VEQTFAACRSYVLHVTRFFLSRENLIFVIFIKKKQNNKR